MAIMVLKPQDVVILIKIHALQGQEWTYASLAGQLKMSPATVHVGLQTASIARLFDSQRKLPIRRNLLEFLLHGVKYCYPPSPGQAARGIPTSYAASPLVSRFPSTAEPAPVWPFPTGMVRGISLEPLYPSVPVAAMADPRFAELMALIDAIRQGRPREHQVAAEELRSRFND